MLYFPFSFFSVLLAKYESMDIFCDINVVLAPRFHCFKLYFCSLVQLFRW